MAEKLRTKCVYFHRRATDNTVFYVGVGEQGYRPKRLDNRNPHWKRVADKYGVVIDVVMQDLTMDEAYLWEILFIAWFGRSNLTNMTDGGAGMPHPNNETRALLAAASGARVHTESEKEKRAAAHRGMKRSPEARKRMSDAAKVKVFSAKHRLNMSVAQKGRCAGLKHPQLNRDLFEFTHTSGDVRKCTMFELRNEFGMNASNLHRACYGGALTCGGWTAKGPL